MKFRSYQQCNRCVMDTTDPNIVFDDEGICNHCEEYKNIRAAHSYMGEQSDNTFNSLISKIKAKGKNKNYDCVVGLSGGIDSSYVAYIAKKNGLRVLGVHMDNGWNSEEAVQNIKNIAKILDIDYESHVLDWEEFKDIQLAFLKASIPEADTPTDIAILSSLHRIASKYGINYILSGGNFATEGILPKYWHYNAKDLTYFQTIQNTFGTKRIKSFPTFGFRSEMYFKLILNIKMIYPLNYIPFDKSEAVKILEKEINWKNYGPKHHESQYTAFIQSYYLYKKFNIDYRKATLSSQICAGTISRPEALKILQTKPYDDSKIAKEIEYIAKKLGITKESLSEIIDSEPKWYVEFSNDERWLNYVYNTYRKVFKKEKLGNF